jgi:hypothetical protein
MLIDELLDIFVRKYRLVDQNCTTNKIAEGRSYCSFLSNRSNGFPDNSYPITVWNEYLERQS